MNIYPTDELKLIAKQHDVDISELVAHYTNTSEWIFKGIYYTPMIAWGKIVLSFLKCREIDSN